jgi:hypothetical protein
MCVQGTTTSAAAFAPKYVDSDGQAFGKPSSVPEHSGAPAMRPYIPFEGESVTKASYPYVSCSTVLFGMTMLPLQDSRVTKYCVVAFLCVRGKHATTPAVTHESFRSIRQWELPEKPRGDVAASTPVRAVVKFEVSAERRKQLTGSQ